LFIKFILRDDVRILFLDNKNFFFISMYITLVNYILENLSSLRRFY